MTDKDPKPKAHGCSQENAIVKLGQELGLGSLRTKSEITALVHVSDLES